MYCCDMSERPISCRFCLPNLFGGVFRSRTALFCRHLKALVTPEPSGSANIVAGPPLNRWMGAAKTIFWIANSILIGTLLAVVCH